MFKECLRNLILIKKCFFLSEWLSLEGFYFLTKSGCEKKDVRGNTKGAKNVAKDEPNREGFSKPLFFFLQI